MKRRGEEKEVVKGEEERGEECEEGRSEKGGGTEWEFERQTNSQTNMQVNIIYKNTVLNSAY